MGGRKPLEANGGMSGYRPGVGGGLNGAFNNPVGGFGSSSVHDGFNNGGGGDGGSGGTNGGVVAWSNEGDSMPENMVAGRKPVGKWKAFIY